MILTTVIIDDEPDAHKLLEYYCVKTGFVKVVKHCFSAKEGLEILTQKSPDFIFIDINMPEISGIEMLNIATKKPRVIFTTAHSEFALEGYEYNTIDYLLKPIRYERFLKAVEKVRELIYPNDIKLPGLIHLESINKKINPAEISHLETLGNYVKIFLWKSDKPELIHMTMIAMENRLLPYGFIRCHKKFLVNTLFISSIMDHFCVLTNGVKIQIGISYYQKVKDFFRDK